MNLAAELERVIAEGHLADTAAQAIRTLLNDARRTATELHAAQTKIQALVLELAHLKRMRYGARSEVLDA